VTEAQKHLDRAGADATIEKAAADKGYHKNETLADCAECGIKAYIPEPDAKHKRRWTNKPPEHKTAVVNNRRRMSRDYGKRLQRKRSELVERSFAHVCETGGARRTWLHGLLNLRKRYTVVAAGRNLGLLMRKLFGIGKPRCLQAGFGLVFLFGIIANRLWRPFIAKSGRQRAADKKTPAKLHQSLETRFGRRRLVIGSCSTGC
jgi:transposase